MNAEDLIALLGLNADDPVVEAVFLKARTRRRPQLDSENPDDVFTWVLVRRQGVELGFVDEVYFKAGEPWKRRRKGVPLILWQVYFYAQRDDVAEDKGKLPFGIEWSDNRDQVRHKLAQFESTRRSYIRDAWDLPAFRMTVDYRKEGKSTDNIVCYLEASSWPEKERIQPQLGFADWLHLLRLPASSPVLRERLRPLDLAKRIERDDDDHEVDFRYECGLELIFVGAENLKRTKQMAPSNRSGNVLGGVRLLRSRELDARQWKGDLPFGLLFDDTQQRMLEKVGRQPDEQEDEGLGGYALWHFPEVSLHVLYSNLKNHLLRVTIGAPGFF
jgi:hypothetical protein